MQASSGSQAPAMQPTRRVAYVLSRFPKITETFILHEMLALRRRGMQVTIHALVRQRTGPIHPEARPLIAEAAYGTDLWPVVSAQAYWLLRRPARYLRTWLEAMRGNLASPRFLLRAAITVPMAAYFARRMRADRVEHIHAHWATHPTLAALVAARLLDVPFSFTAHAHDLYVNRTMLREKVRAAAFVGTISDYNRRLLAELYPADAPAKTVVIHCGVDLSFFRPAVHQTGSTPWRVICVASLEPQKGHATLIAAIARLRDRGVSVLCQLVGDGQEAPALRRQVAELGLEAAVQLLGSQPRNEVLSLLGRADAMALASTPLSTGKMEGIPVAVMEAMAMELPVVVSEISGIPELVENEVTGLLVPPGDASALADALERIQREPELASRLGAAGRERVEREFDLAQTTRLLAERFDQAVIGRRRPS